MVRWVALSLGCLFLLPSCLGGCGFRWPDDPSSYDRDTWHRDHEDEGEDVAVDLCWGVTCEVGGTCDPLTGECSHPHPCEWLECGPCELCDWDEEECVSLCGAEECCYDGQCAICGTWCDPDCGPCEICEDDRCSSTCAEGEVCFLEACCLPDCEGLECGDDGCGGSCGVCDSEATEYCTREQRCEDIPTCGGCPGCLRDRECCDAGVIDELRIATGPDAETGDPGCCCDYDGDGIADNALATLVANVGSMADLNLDDVNALVAESIASGAFLVLLDYLCFQGDEPLDYVVVNLLLGEDLDDDPSDNFDGEETFTFHPDSLNDDGDPLFEFRGAEIGDDGVFRAPGGGGFSGQFFVPLSSPDDGRDTWLLVDGVRLEADLRFHEGRYELANGTLCGYVTADQILGRLNAFVAANCDCLNLDGELVLENGDGTFTCTTPSAAPTCDPNDVGRGEIEEICNYATQYCNTALELLPMFMDVDTDGDPSTGEAISLGAYFHAAPARIAAPDLDEEATP